MKAIKRVGESLTAESAKFVSKPIEEWSIGELLIDNARLAMLRMREFVSRGCDETLNDRPIQEQRLIFDASSTVAKLLANVQLEQMRAKRSEEQFTTFMATVDAFETQLYGSVKERKATAAAQREKK